MIIEQTESILKEVAESMLSKQKNFRQVVGVDNIYTLKLPASEEGGEPLEMEVVPVRHFIHSIGKLSSMRLQPSEKEFLTRIFSVRQNEQLI
jgi:hypothetical protein